jgi:hypothetical protein
MELGVIMELTCGGAAKIVICDALNKTSWVDIPSYQYSLEYRANEAANIPDELQKCHRPWYWREMYPS